MRMHTSGAVKIMPPRQATRGKEDLHLSASSQLGCASKGTHGLIVFFGRAAPTYEVLVEICPDLDNEYHEEHNDPAI
jgi:hypothetical protein